MSEQSTALVQPSTTIVPTAEQYKVILHTCEMLAASGLMPTGVDTKEQVFAVVQKGRELGLPPMAALSGIAVIKGKPTCSAELMASLIYRDHGGNALRMIESTDQLATYEFKRREWQRPQNYTFTLQQAQKAGLLGKQDSNWSKYPEAMLRARCISAIARMAFPDSIMGMYTPDEIDTIVVESSPAALADDAGTDEVQRTVDAETGEILSEEPETLEAEARNYHVRDLTAPAPDESKREPFAPVGPSTTAQIAKYCTLMKREEPDYTSLTQEQGKQLLDELVADYGATKKAEVAAESTARAAAAADTSMGQDTAPGPQQQLDELASLTGKDPRDLQKETAIRLSKGGMKVLVPFGKNDGSTRVKIAADLQGQIARAKNEQAVGAS